jgi:hypothetical protein
MKIGGISTILFLLSVLVIASASATTVQAATDGCFIQTWTTLGMAYQSDRDCDGAIDATDNCPSIANADQKDMNRNGRGDVCDLLIEEIIVNPDNHLLQGEIAHITTRIVNNRDTPISGVTITVKNTALGIDATKTLPFIPQGDVAVVDFWLVIPKCANVKSYDLSVSATHLGGTTESQRETIYVEKGTVCGTKNTTMDFTVVKVLDRFDLDRGDSAVTPITITNLGDRQATYDLSVKDLDFGTWRIDPAPRMTLAAGHEDEAYLYLSTNPNAQPGTRTLQLTVTSDGKTTTVPITVYVRAPIQRSILPFILLQLFIILILLALIIMTVVLAVRYRKERKTKDGPHAGNTHNASNASEKPRRTVAVEPAGKPKLETYY